MGLSDPLGIVGIFRKPIRVLWAGPKKDMLTESVVGLP